MTTSMFRHLFRLDGAVTGATQHKADGWIRSARDDLGEGFLIAEVDPIEFTHAYALLGGSSQRFGQDLRIYLATVRSFFDAMQPLARLRIPATASSDHKRRLAEDLGVALAAGFMVHGFDLDWTTVSQIPQNAKLVKKRPDFQGYTTLGDARYLFEAKGTTAFGKVEKAMTTACGQVKAYPERATAKLAIVSYLESDPRFFPSFSFVVDPPAMPDSVPADPEVARLLHFEKVLQFAGLPETAKRYVDALAAVLRGEWLSEGRVAKPADASKQLTARLDALKESFSSERARTRERWMWDGREAEGPESFLADGVNVWFGCETAILEAGTNFSTAATRALAEVRRDTDEVASRFPDGTILRVRRTRTSVPVA